MDLALVHLAQVEEQRGADSRLVLGATRDLHQIQTPLDQELAGGVEDEVSIQGEQILTGGDVAQGEATFKPERGGQQVENRVVTGGVLGLVGQGIEQ